MKIELIFVYLLKMLLNKVEHFQSHAIVSLSQVWKPDFVFIPHALHIMNIQILAFFAEQTHNIFSFLEFINSD